MNHVNLRGCIADGWWYWIVIVQWKGSVRQWRVSTMFEVRDMLSFTLEGFSHSQLDAMSKYTCLASKIRVWSYRLDSFSNCKPHNQIHCKTDMHYKDDDQNHSLPGGLFIFCGVVNLVWFTGESVAYRFTLNMVTDRHMLMLGAILHHLSCW